MIPATYADCSAALAEVVAIPVTPFTEDGALDLPAHRALLSRLLDSGVRTLTPNGNTGEFYALALAERRTLTEATLAEAAGRAAVVVGVGHDVPTAVAEARHARDAGARMVMVHQPAHPYVSAGGWGDYHRAIAEAVPELGVVPYLRTPRLACVPSSRSSAHRPTPAATSTSSPVRKRCRTRTRADHAPFYLPVISNVVREALARRTARTEKASWHQPRPPEDGCCRIC